MNRLREWIVRLCGTRLRPGRGDAELEEEALSDQRWAAYHFRHAAASRGRFSPVMSRSA